MRCYWTVFFVGALLASPASAASDSGTDVVRDLAGRVGPIVGAALACRDIARTRLQVIVDKFHAVIRDASAHEAERSDLAQAFDRSITDGTNLLTSGKTDCTAPDYTSLEGSARVLIEATKRTGPQIDTERLVENLEAMNNFDLGVGSTLSFSRGEHRASHKIWGTALDETGIYQPIELE
jgi:hypothetical protein